MTISSNVWMIHGYSPHSEKMPFGFCLPILLAVPSGKLAIQVGDDGILPYFTVAEVSPSDLELVKLPSQILCSPQKDRVLCFVQPDGEVIAGDASAVRQKLFSYAARTDADPATILQIADLYGEKELAHLVESQLLNTAARERLNTGGFEASLASAALYEIAVDRIKGQKDALQAFRAVVRATRFIRGWNIETIPASVLNPLIEATKLSIDELQSSLEARQPLRATSETLRQSSVKLTTEYQISLCVIEIASRSPSRICSFSEARRLIPKMLPLTEYDLSPSPSQEGRARWEQRINNIKSNYQNPGNFIYRGLLQHVPRVGYKATDKGLEYLRKFKASHSAATA
jgi:hypothetical protein